uniref:Uncharacterized protein n=1 Tax=Oryza sativa subsp. japonica TaxID=39947 RepID=Q5VRI7_ORYSJ|nr:hypothetical protein [Oryza sativa Japonica Group]
MGRRRGGAGLETGDGDGARRRDGVLQKLVLAAVHGACIGGGGEVLAACAIRAEGGGDLCGAHGWPAKMAKIWLEEWNGEAVKDALRLLKML